MKRGAGSLPHQQTAQTRHLGSCSHHNREKPPQAPCGAGRDSPREKSLHGCAASLRLLRRRKEALSWYALKSSAVPCSSALVAATCERSSSKERWTQRATWRRAHAPTATWRTSEQRGGLSDQKLELTGSCRQKRLVYNFVKFLETCLEDGSIREDDKEGVEVACALSAAHPAL